MFKGRSLAKSLDFATWGRHGLPQLAQRPWWAEKAGDYGRSASREGLSETQGYETERQQRRTPNTKMTEAGWSLIPRGSPASPAAPALSYGLGVRCVYSKATILLTLRLNFWALAAL